MSSATMTRSRAQTATQPPPVAEVPEVGFRRLRSETMDLPRQSAIEAAQRHLSLPQSPTERSLEPKRVRELVERIKSGVWLPCCWATVKYGGSVYRMNGQHSSQAMLDATDYLPAALAIHLDHFEADSPDSMGLLFRQFDARMSSRSKQDVAGAYQGLVPNLADIPRPKAKLGVEGIAWYERVIEGLPVDAGDELYHSFFEVKYHKFLLWMHRVLNLKTPELLKPSVLAAMYGTYLRSESGSQEFWHHVAKADLPDDSDPRTFLSAEMVRLKEDRSGSKMPPPVEFYAKCVKAWNAFRAGDKVRSLNVNVKKGLPEIAA